tara:strand:- start:270 stop:830 length:561 start_codon:yes stop_codon:yes gene_type:complete
MTPKYKVIKDTREQDGWFFSPYDKCSGMEVGTLNTGDYTLEGFEDVVCIERKASVSEIAINLGKKKKPFYNEIERMRDFHFRYLLLEFSASDLIDYPHSLLKTEEDKELYEAYKEGKISLPKFKRFQVIEQTKISGRYLLKALMEISISYDVNVIFCDNKHNAFMVCNSIFKRLNDLFHKEQDVKR